jgi:predicted alpha/beta superfamily hydrolase
MAEGETNMKNFLGLLAAAAVLVTMFSACDPVQTPKTPEEMEAVTPPAEVQTPIELKNHMTQAERDSITWGEISRKHKYYDQLAGSAPYIQELSVYDEELGTTYIIHLTLPPGYDENKSYPIYLLLDGLWRILDLVDLRQMVADGDTGDIIIATIGYQYGTEGDVPQLRQSDFTVRQARFLDFITDNLMPCLGERYNIDYRHSTLEGHSFGGVFAYYALFIHDTYENDPFGCYVMSSPTFYVKDQYYSWRDPLDWKQLRDLEAEYWQRENSLDKDIYLAAGDLDTLNADIEAFAARMKESSATAFTYKMYAGNHSSYVSQMLRDSVLKFYGTGE